MTFTLFLLTCLSQYIQAVYGNNGDGGILERQDATQDSSNTRSLWSIVSGCFATIFACTWISVHSNIPAPNDNPLEVLGRRLAIMLNLLIAPEFVIAWTARQYIASREISKRHKARGWTKTHAFFVIMGGFALYENKKIVRTLDIQELEKLEAEGKIDWPEITEEEIKDKSKGDYFSKGVVVLQTCWFIAQVIARGVEHMVVTELEVVTLAFSALTMIIYFLWWNKPLDVGVPVPVRLKESSSAKSHLTTQMQELSPSTSRTAEGGETGRISSSSLPSQHQCTTFSQSMGFIPSHILGTESEPFCTSPEDLEMGPLVTNKDEPPISAALGPRFYLVREGKRISCGPSSRNNTSSSQSSEQADHTTPGSSRSPIPAQHHPSNVTELTSPSEESTDLFDIGREESWLTSKKNLFIETIEEARQRYQTHNFIVATLLCIAVVVVFIILLSIYVVIKPLREFIIALSGMVACTKLRKRTPTRVPSFYAPKSENDYASYLIIIAVGVVFGSIHCIAWNFQFPTAKEKLLWRITAAIIAAMPLTLLAIMVVLGLITGSASDEKEGEDSAGNEEDDEGCLSWLSVIILFLGIFAIILLVLAYIGARLCLLVLPLYALRALPRGAYDDVDWSIFLPHFHI